MAARMTGITPAMKKTLDALVEFIGLHGAVPSVRALAAVLEQSPTTVNCSLQYLVERGHITRGKYTLALGGAGVAVIVPADVASALARFCAKRSESLSAVVADAVALHIDQVDASDPASSVEAG
jgi:DNA-binding transcriptional regulator YhcF (GntR family)